MSTIRRSRSEGFFIESASTGRFRIDLEASNGWKLSQSQNSSTVIVQSDSSALLFDKQILGFAFIGFHFLQGIVSGMSVSSLYEALALDESNPRDFIALHSTVRANEIRRYFFLGITFCVLGSLCMIKEEDVSRVVGIIKGSSSSTSSSTPRITAAATTWSSTPSLGCLIIFYFTALIMTLLCSSVDFKIVINQSDEKLLTILQLWRCYSVTRGILCIVGWLISCYRFVIMRVRVRDDRYEDCVGE
jgi:hypothetical protein